MEQRKKVVLKREKRSSGNKERQFRPTFPEHFRLLKLSERRRRRRWHRHRPLRSFSRPAHIVKASSCASPMRDLKRREEGTRLAIPLRRSRSSPEPNLRASPLSPSIVWFGWPLEIKRSSSLLTPPSVVPFLYPSGFAAKTEIPPSYKGRSRLDHAGLQVCLQWLRYSQGI